MSNNTITMTLHAETESQVISDNSTKIATALKYILANPGFISINKENSISFIDILTMCGNNHTKLSTMLSTALSDVCTKLLPDISVSVDVDIEEFDAEDYFNISISIKNNSGIDVIESTSVKSVNGVFEVIYK